MSVRRLQKLVERAERQFKGQITSEHLGLLGYIPIDEVWYGPDSYMAPFMDEVLRISRELHEADKTSRRKRTKQLVSELGKIQQQAIERLRGVV